MTAVRLAWLELRRFRGRPLRHAALAVIVLFPLLYGALYLWSNWDPYGKSDQVPVAVVDEDEGAEYDGGTLHAGREFVEQLKTSPMLDWNFVDAEQAEAGMADGDYYFAIVVPSDFSQKLATLAGADPERAHLLVELDDANGYIAGIMAKTMELELQNQINTAVYTTFAKSMFSDLGALHDGLNDAADAASSLEDGAEQTDESLAELVAALEALDSGAGDVAEGTEELDGKVRDIADFVGSASGTADGALADLKTDIDEASENCRGDNCEEMRELADTAAEVIPLLQGDIATADRIVQEDASDVQDLADGARAVSDGTGEVRDGASQLSDGAS
ncbi:MAG: YhgE/Pip domain-containing protein, partial [Stackebrandtia sp.]